MITLALAGKPNCGKSTFFKAATMANAEIANYPFTTINPNFGVAYVRTTCPCKGLDLNCGHCCRRGPVRCRQPHRCRGDSFPTRTRVRASATSSSTTSVRPMRSCT